MVIVDITSRPINVLIHHSCARFIQHAQSLIEEDTPFGRIARPFFHGNDDEYRNGRFKFIPKVRRDVCQYAVFLVVVVL